MIKTVRFGRFLIRSRFPILPCQLRILNHRDADAIALVREKVIRGSWTIVELAK